MHKKLFPLIVFVFSAFSFASQVSSGYQDKEACKKEAWYSDMLQQLASETRIDSLDARMIKMTSSNSYVAFHELAFQIVKRYGKIEERDIISICTTMKKDNNFFYVFTRSGVYCHLFIYQTADHKLKRIQNKGPIVVTGSEELILKDDMPDSTVFCAKSNVDEGWTKYFYLDKKNNFLAHIKNCRTINGREECNIFKKHEH